MDARPSGRRRISSCFHERQGLGVSGFEGENFHSVEYGSVNMQKQDPKLSMTGSLAGLLRIRICW